ncbi:hypothetical protein Tdes44962_MAKER06395 [Teratosphaeria destructans]|uniref:Uncharacterized protein n=1 Tax=Teratosphaeria destructans TaxID=418781 RepID=A0A9W7SHJ6_9PEZI|nr:hypothetical protein Tdes44962_MAKER06395 [Teratosphaeria destructans]
MAGFLNERLKSRISYNGSGGMGEQELPAGSCNFRDLSLGQRATCGCKRFWLNEGRAGASAEKGWCFCGHHACFHDAFNQQQQQEGVSVASRMPSRNPWPVEGYVQVDPRMEIRQTPTRPTTGLGIRAGPSSHSQSVNTRLWDALNHFARQQEDGGASDVASKLPSTACPSVVGEPRLSPRRMLQERAQSIRPMGPPVTIPSGYQAVAGSEVYSATEVATPSVRGTPDLRAFSTQPAQLQSPPVMPAFTTRATSEPPPNEPPRSSVESPSTRLGRISPPSFNPPEPTMSVDEMRAMLHAIQRRVEVLEGVSFSHVPVEEVQEQFQLFEARLLDLEQWRTDEETTRQSPEQSPEQEAELEQSLHAKRRRLLPNETSSFASDVSFAAAHTEAAVLATLAVNAETGPRIDALESRITELEHATMPSFARPWQIQVVLLPWGRQLRGVWFSALDSTQHMMKSSAQAYEEWSGGETVPGQQSCRSFATGAWTTESIRAWADEAQEWLSPKACGPSGTVFQRLASRGLVQEISLSSSDSHHILEKLCDAFGSTLPLHEAGEPPQAQHFHGLRESFIPLRKVRKSSRLRFLSPAEMVTPALWSAGFLDSSVMMKINNGPRRLYLTTADAYMQRDADGWSWQALRNLPLYDADGEEQAAQAQHVAVEACWSYNHRLDVPVSSYGSFASQMSAELEPLDAEDDQISAPAADTTTERSQDTLQGPGACNSHQRTVSMPSSSPVTEEVQAALPKPLQAGLPKRRVASFDTNMAAYADGDPTIPITIVKRRRISISPEVERKGAGITPRWSREPPSPYTSEQGPGEAVSQATSGRKRGTTPFAYATPHSNSNYMGRLEYFGGDGDTEADTDMPTAPSEKGDDEWNGVQDELGDMRATDAGADDENSLGTTCEPEIEEDGDEFDEP